MTEEYTVVQLKRQEELTCRIQQKLNEAACRINGPEATLIAPAQNSATAGQNCLALDSPQSNECDGSIHQQRREPMPTFIVDRENRIGIIRSEEGITQGRKAFTTKQSLATLAARWPGKRLVQIWNGIPGVKPIDRFTDRKTAIDRIWSAIQPLGAEAANTGRPVPVVLGATKRKRARRSGRNKRVVLKLQKVRVGSKKAEIFKLLHRPAGVTLKDLMAATGWQAHSVRGFISAGSKGMGLRVESSKRGDGQRVYQIR